MVTKSLTVGIEGANIWPMLTPDAKHAIHDELTKAIDEGDKLSQKTVRDWVKASPKKTCPRCGGKGIRKNEKVVYAGVPGGCYQCNTTGEVTTDTKGLGAVMLEAELTRLRNQWKAYQKALAAVAALPEYRMKKYDMMEYQQMMERTVKQGQALKGE